MDAHRPPTLYPLTGLRFFAAIAVVACHYSLFWRTGAVSVPWLATLMGNGNLGVNIFFILSGFILTYTYLPVDAVMKGTLFNFYIARVARIVPVYFLALAVAAVPLWWRGGAPEAPQGAACLESPRACRTPPCACAPESDL